MLLHQAEKIQADYYKPDLIVGLSRGGLIPSRFLADLLQTKDLAIISVEHYVGINQTLKEPTLKQCLHVPLTDQKVLVVDDISDSGKSLQLATKHLHEQGSREIKTAALYCKPCSRVIPDYFEKQTSNWVVFPWEAKETITRIQQKTNNKQALSEEIALLVEAGFSRHLAEKLLKEHGRRQ